ncbi:MAG: caspase family protein [Deltaproteobacteria bacterium]|nr:caspase family protein [Deltaproteobacteria bacterium]
MLRALVAPTSLATTALVLSVLATTACPATDGCFCCNNCVTNYFVDMPKGQSADALYRQQDYQACVERSAQLRTPTAYQKIVHAKCLEETGEFDQARTLYREIVAGDPQLNYPPAREATDRLATLGQRGTRGASPSAWPSLSNPPRRVSGGEGDAAVVVGVGQSFVLPPIPGAAESATDWYRYLTGSLGVPPDRVTLLRNGEATREAVLDAAERAAGAVKGGRVWFVFIGHGAPARGGDDGLLLGADTQATEASLEARGLPQRTIFAALQKGRATQVIAVIDACFSGSAPDGVTPLVPGSQATVPVRRSAPGARLTVLSSSERIAGPLPHGDRPAFSYLVLGALFGWADQDADGRVTAGETIRYVGDVLRAAVTDRDQFPRLEARDTNEVLAPSAGASAPDVAAIVAGAVARY